MASSRLAHVLGILTGALFAFGCGGPAARSTLARPPLAAPAVDLAEAKSATPTDGPGEARPGSGPQDPKVIDLDTIRIQVVARTPAGEPELISVATADLFNGASATWKEGRGLEAVGLFRRLVAEFPDSAYAPLALHNIAAIYDGRGDATATITTLLELIAAYPSSRQSVQGQLYVAALYSERKQWSDAVATLERALARRNFTYADRLEAWARKGYALLELGRLEEADAALLAAVGEWRKAPHLDDSYFIAMAQYYRGELAHRRFLAAKIELPDDHLGESRDAKEALAVEAYGRWREALSHRHAYWSTAAGYQMSQVFAELWEAMVKAPYPLAMSPSARRPYVVEVHQRVRTHLQKALEGHQMNVQLAEAYGVTTSWSEASKGRIVQLMEILTRDANGQYVLPGAP